MLPIAQAAGARTKTAAGSKPGTGASATTTTTAPAKPAQTAGTTATGFEAHAREEHAPEAALRSAAGAHAAPTTPPKAPDASTSKTGVRTGSHKGSRDTHIEQLKQQIGDLTTKKSILDAVPAALPFIGLLAKPVIDKIAGEDVQKDIQKIKDQLSTEKTLNFLADTMYALGAPQTAVNALDGAQKINVVPDSKLDSDAEYDSATGAINVSQSLIDKAAADQKKLEAQGILAPDGTIVDPKRLDTSPIADDTVKIATLVGVHEATHAAQDKSGVVDDFNKENTQVRSEILGSVPQQAQDRETRDALHAEADDASNALRQQMLEYQAYNAQEKVQLATGAPGRVHVTIDEHGNDLPKPHAVANIAAFEADAPLPYGPDAGIRKSDFSATGMSAFIASIAQAVAASTVAGTTDLPGGKFPGGKFPGGKFPGGKFPGGKFPGGKFPGGKFPGGKFPGGKFPGGKFPGDTFPGGKFPGGKFPGGKFPGGKFPGGKFPGDTV